MRVTLAATLAILFVTVPALADEFVNGYYRQNGTYVQPHMRSSPDGNPFNNYSTQGNVNPYTGAVGTHNPYATPNYGVPSYGVPSYGLPQTSPYTII